MKKFRVIIVDDDKDVLTILKIQFRDKYEIITIVDPGAVLEKVKLYEPDIIVLDIMMPKISGFELCQQIRALPRFRKTPIIFLSAKKSLDDHKLGYRVGANLYIDKPFDTKRLQNNIDVLLQEFYQDVPSKNFSFSDIIALESGTAKLQVPSETKITDEQKKHIPEGELRKSYREEIIQKAFTVSADIDTKDKSKTERIEIQVEESFEEITVGKNIKPDKLTIEKPEEKPQIPTTQSPPPDKIKKDREKKKQPLIIIVDDDEEVLDVLDATLSIKGFRVLGAVDGSSGFKKISTKNPDLVIIDLYLPKMSGKEIISKMKKTSNLANIPVLVLTATTKHSPLSDKELAKYMNVDDFITKPFDPKDILKRVSKLLPEYE